jgi:arabinan endo-1,5-alpha-L-arabinosidase
VFLGNEGRFVGPGHIGILPVAGQTWISYHTHDAGYNGRSRLYIRQLNWTRNGWPVAGRPLAAVKNH